MTYKESLRLLAARGFGNKKNTLPDFKKTAHALGLKKLPYKIIHVAGTNGKGAVCLMLASALKESGFKTGLYTSPHVYDIRERIEINGKKIAKKTFADCVRKVVEKETCKLKYFEILTLCALLYFKQKGVDYAVVECGIGGKKDCTNIVNPVLSVITSVDKDHQNILGKTLKEIAAQKAGIIKKNVPVICGPMAAQAARSARKAARAKGAPQIFTPKAQTAAAQNKNIVFACARRLGLPQAACLRGLNLRALPCRFEIKKCGGKVFILDGAHNPSAVKEFVKVYKKSAYFSKEAVLIYAASKDKDYKTCARILRPVFQNVILTRADEACGVEPQELKKYFPSAVLAQNPREINLKVLKSPVCVLGTFRIFSLLPFPRAKAS